MSLSAAETNKLREQYQHLLSLVTKREIFTQNREEIIEFCRVHEIPLYNVIALPLQKGAELLDTLVDMVATKPLKQGAIKAWKTLFQQELAKTDIALHHAHAHDYSSIAEQYQKTGIVPSTTSLTSDDLQMLLSVERYQSEKVVLIKKPVALGQISNELETIKERIKDNPNKLIFLPVNFNGHWFYLLKANHVWSMHDSLPNKATIREKLMMDASLSFLQVQLGENVPYVQGYNTAKQKNAYDCGVQVVNAYRSLVDTNYVEQDYKQAVAELLQAEPKPSHYVESKTKRSKAEQGILEATLSAQTNAKHKKPYEKQIAALLASKETLFKKVVDKIDVAAIDQAKALEGESDEDFRDRLQEAELRKAGLDKV